MDVLNRDRSPVCGQHMLLANSNSSSANSTNNSVQAANSAQATSTSAGNANNSSSSTLTHQHSGAANASLRNHQILESSVQRNLTNFSLITHGFGTPAIMAALNVVRAYLNESMKIIDRQSGGSSAGAGSASLAVNSTQSHQQHLLHAANQHHQQQHSMLIFDKSS